MKNYKPFSIQEVDELIKNAKIVECQYPEDRSNCMQRIRTLGGIVYHKKLLGKILMYSVQTDSTVFGHSVMKGVWQQLGNRNPNKTDKIQLYVMKGRLLLDVNGQYGKEQEYITECYITASSGT